MRRTNILKRSFATLLALSIVSTSGSMPSVLAAEQDDNAASQATTTEIAAPQEAVEEENVEEPVIEVEEQEEASDKGGTDASTGKTVTENAPADEGKTAAAETVEDAGESGTEKTGETDEITDDKTPVEETKEEDKAEKKYRFRVDFDGAGTVKVILASDEGANKDDPSATIIKDAEGKDEKNFRNENVKALTVEENDTDLVFELKEGEKVEVVTEAAEGYKVSEYRVTTDSGADVEADPSSWEYTIDENTALNITTEKEPEKAQNGSVAVKVSSAGGSVTVTNGESSYTIAHAADGSVAVTDQDGNTVATEGDFDLVVEDEIGKTVSVKASAEEGAHVTAFAVTGGAEENAETPAFKAEDKPAEFAQDIEIAEGQKVVTISFAAMPEFTAEQTVGKYVVKIHAAAGILPAGTVAEIRELSDEEAKPLVKETEKTAGGEVVAAIDITFKDVEGKEVQPAGMVDVTFDKAVEDGLEMSVVHAVDGKTDKLETVPTDTEGDSVKFQSDSFSPFLLTASAAEPGSNWTKGGGGIKDVSSQLSVMHDDEYRYFYRDYGFFNGDDDYPGDTFCFGMYVDGQRVGWSVCVDPLRDGRDMEGVWAGEVWQVNAPMFVKVMYYGPDGPRSDVIKSATGYSDYGALNIIAHVAASEIYARLGYSSQSNVGDGFLAASGSLRNAVYKYVNTIADMDTPSGYYTYVTEKNGYSGAGYRHQNFAFGSFSLLKGSAQVKKVSANPGITNGNRCYSFEGARYWIYTSREAALNRGDAGWVSGGTLVCDANGNSGTFQLDPGTYYMIEGAAPTSYIRSDEVYQFTVSRGKTTVVTVSDTPANDPINVGIDKLCKNAVDGHKINSLEDTQFTIKYYDGYYDATNLPASATRTWTIHPTLTNSGKYHAPLDQEHLISGDAFYATAYGTALMPLGTITIEETKSAPGYENDGTFGDAKMYIGQFRRNNSASAGASLVNIQGNRKTGNTFEMSDTPLKPNFKTTATDTLTNSHSAYPGSEVTINDEVVYENLIVGVKYTLKGQLLDRNTGAVIKDANGNPVTAEKEFTCESINGSVNISFTFPASVAFRGKTTVVGETLINEYGDTLVHADITDEAQTVRFPEIRTTAVGAETGIHIVRAGEDAKIDDTIAYKNLVVGQEYISKGIVMDKATNAPLLVNGEEVRVEKTFTAEANDGSVVMNFVFDAKGLEGKELVIFEELYVGDALVADHKDIKDLGQTVSVPGVKTESKDDATETKNQLAAKDQVIVDAVTYKGLVAGREYEITGETKIKAEGIGSFDDAETVPSTIIGATGEGQITFDDEKVTFTPAGEKDALVDGVVYVSFKVDASDLAGEEVVVGETIWYNGKEIAVHRDINDKKQNIIYPAGKTAAIDTETGIKNALAADNRVFKDTFEYTNLLPGETYRFTGTVWAEKLDENNQPVTDENGNTVMEEIPSVMVDENGDPVPNGYVEFVPEPNGDAQAVAGSLDLYFSIDASELANRDVTVFEKVTLNGAPVLVHEVLDGTQTIYIPEGQTTAIDSESMDQIAFADEEITIYDTFKYRNLIPGTEYTLAKRVMLKDSAEEIESTLTEAEFVALDDAETTGTITVADNIATFTPDQKDGAIKLSIVINGSDLAGEDVVVFERAYHNGKEVIIHENLEDENQTVHIPDGFTQATDPDTDEHTMMAKGPVTIRDRVHYENVIPGYEYVLGGKVMLKPLGDEEPTELEAKLVDAEGNEVEEWKFTAENKDGDEYLYFVINSDDLAGRSVVMFETMEFINPELETRTTIFTHEDIDDEEQTVHFPDGRTTALDSDTGSHTSYADEEVTINDEVIFENLIPGKLYTLDGVLYDKATGLPLIVDGKEVVAHKEFVPETADGSTIVEFTFNGLGLAGKTVVAGETVKSNGKEVFIHFDLEDEEQTVRFPEVKTTAVDKKDGDHEISYKGTVTIVDTVSYKNVAVGTKYHVYGVLMNKTTGQPAKANGKEIVGDATFVAKAEEGTVQVSFKFNAAELKAGDYVVFETLYEVNAQTGDEKPVGSHKDLNDKSQTVRRPPTPSGSKTGDDNKPYIWLAVLAVSCMAVFGIYAAKRRKG